ncbi:MAG: ISNCY family transposase [Rhodocyclaceae bacterium]|nr:ISNCY family transposase [Rhodocyclaceae bacterium]
MNMQAKNQYLQTLIQNKGYYLKTKKEKSKLLDEYCRNTGQNRKYIIRKIRNGRYLENKNRITGKQRNRKSYYDGYVKNALIKCWEIFDYPCGQRLQTLLETEVDKLKKLGELNCSDETTKKLKQIKSATIDRKLVRHKEKERLKNKYKPKNNPLLYQKIPVKVFAEQDRNVLGNVQIDLVEHCGQSARGEYICTLSNTDIATGWWEGEAIMGRGQQAAFNGLERQRIRFPFAWTEIHSDNGNEFINWHLFRWSEKENIGFSRSRPYKKNDNCLVEQKNWTHVKKFVGYYRYDTDKESGILNDLYRNELRLYKNFFQPVIKLISKERIGGKIKRRYDKAKTPYQRVIESDQVLIEQKQELTKIYQSLNPAELKRKIDEKLNLLYQAYQNKNNESLKVKNNKKLKPNMVTFLNVPTEAISVT